MRVGEENQYIRIEVKLVQWGEGHIMNDAFAYFGNVLVEPACGSGRFVDLQPGSEFPVYEWFGCICLPEYIRSRFAGMVFSIGKKGISLLGSLEHFAESHLLC